MSTRELILADLPLCFVSTTINATPKIISMIATVWKL